MLPGDGLEERKNTGVDTLGSERQEPLIGRLGPGTCCGEDQLVRGPLRERRGLWQAWTLRARGVLTGLPSRKSLKGQRGLL